MILPDIPENSPLSKGFRAQSARIFERSISKLCAVLIDWFLRAARGEFVLPAGGFGGGFDLGEVAIFGAVNRSKTPNVLGASSQGCGNRSTPETKGCFGLCHHSQMPREALEREPPANVSNGLSDPW